MDFGQIDGGLIGSGMGQFMRLVMIFPVLIGEFKLGAAFLGQCHFPLIKLSHPSCPVGAMIVAALVDGHFFSLFPGEEGVVAVGAVVLGLALAESFFLLKELFAYLAKELRSFLAVIVVKIGMGGLAGGAAGGLRDPRGAGPVLYRR